MDYTVSSYHSLGNNKLFAIKISETIDNAIASLGAKI